MLKLNRKGFTLVELLAVVVVLSISVGVAVPVTTNVITNSKYKTLMSISDEAEEFIADQWKLMRMDPDAMDDGFESIMDGYTASNDDNNPNWKTLNNTQGKALIESMGIDIDDVTEIKVSINSKNIPCVVITKIPKSSGLYNSKYWNDLDNDGIYSPITGEGIDNKGYYSKCCDPGAAQIALND